MIYHKANLSHGIELKVPFNEQNLYIQCTECGKEMNVSAELLASLIITYGGDLKGAITLCETCIDEQLKTKMGGCKHVYGSCGNCGGPQNR